MEVNRMHRTLRTVMAWLILLCLFATPSSALCEDMADLEMAEMTDNAVPNVEDSAPVVEDILPGGEIIPPAYSVPEHVVWLLDIARAELGNGEDKSGRTKYGEWSGDPYAQWCAEFVCWCVDQMDIRYGTAHLTNTFPKYSATNVGRNWFIRQGRYVARTGFVPDWGAQWYRGETEQMERNTYIPQPGDWMFFSTISSGDTTHVAMVEYCSRDAEGNVYVHVIEGNNPDKVQRKAYPLDAWYVLGYGTVHDVASTTLRNGNFGQVVLDLQEKLILLGYLDAQYNTGKFATLTGDAIMRFQAAENISQTGIAGPLTQQRLEECVKEYYQTHTEEWVVEE